jgi:hypothetical protein
MPGCNKVYHFSKESAENHALTLEEFCGAKPNVYKCKHCGQWHVGYDARTSKLSKRARRRRTYMNRKRRKRRRQDASDSNAEGN